MQRDREVRENSHTSGSPFDGFGIHGSMIPSMFGGKDPFDDPFFSRPYGSLFGSEAFGSNNPRNPQQTSKSNAPVIKELDSDAEEVLEEEEKDGSAWSNRNPLVEHPEDQANDKGNSNNNSNGREVTYNTNYNKAEGARPQTRSISFQRVTYGGINGAYYTSTASRRTGSDGVTMEERKQADRTTGQATHRVSRGIHDKGHSLTRKLDSDGKVDTVQTLHNLNEDELEGFEQAWGANADRHFHGWNDSFDFPRNFRTSSSSRLGQLVARGGFPDPFRELSYRNGGSGSEQNPQGQSARGRPKKVVSINIE